MALHSTGNVGSSTNALLAVHCDGPIDPGRVRRAVERFLSCCPWPAARLRRPFPWGKLHWATNGHTVLSPPSVRGDTVATTAQLHQVLDAEINAAIDPRREAPVRFRVLDTASADLGAGGVLVVTWFHPLMDPRGAQNLLRHLTQLDVDAGDTQETTTGPAFVRAPDPRSFSERGRLARRSLDYMRTLPRTRPVPTATAASGRVRFRLASFVERAGGPRRSRATREIWWRLAVVGKAMRGLWERRRVPDVPFLLPVAVDLRPKGEPGPVFGNTLAFHFARFKPSDAADVPRLARVLRDQMAEAVREGQIEANDVAMDFLQYRPLPLVRRALRRTGGATFSFNCADVSDFPATLVRCFGPRVVNAYHVPAVPPRPGLGVFFNRCAGRNNLVIAWIDGVVTDDDVNAIVEVVREEMGWIETS